MYRMYFGNTLMPVAPGALKMKIKNQNETVSLVSEGELNILKSPGLTELSFTLLLPRAPYAFALYEDGFKPPDHFLALFEKLKTERRAFDFTVLRRLDSGAEALSETNMKCALEDYTVSESAEDGMDFSVDVTLRQYVPYGVKTLVVKNNEATETTDRDAGGKEKTERYTVRDGDTRWDIARTELGDGTRWKEIYQLNKKVLDDEASRRGMPAESGSRWIFTGTVIQIPS